MDNDLSIKFEAAVRDIVDSDVRVLTETQQDILDARLTVRCLVEYEIDDLSETLGSSWDAITLRAECRSRTDNPEAATAVARAIRRKAPASLEDGSIMLLEAGLESPDIEDDGRYQVDVVFSGGARLEA